MIDSKWAAAIRRAIQTSGLTLRALSRATGVQTSALSRFVAGTRTLTLPNAELVAVHLGMKLFVPAAARPKKGRKP